ncbi:MAG: FAD-dependent pyridine nucleotide-disulfide oxidoreductase, partial [Halanaerobium sp. T82-1]
MMSKKVVIVGGVAGGASTAARLRRMDEDLEIIMLEKGEYISFANCGLPYHIGEVIKDREKLLVQTPQSMQERFKIDVRIQHQAVKINRQQKSVEIKDLKSGEIYTESYDKLVLSPGAEPIKPPLSGLDFPEVFTLRNIPDTDKIKNFVDNQKPTRAVVVGGGFIGLEMAENLHERGIEVSVVEMMDQLMGSLDYEMAAMLHNHLRTKGIDLHLGDGIAAVEEADQRKIVKLQSGKTIKTDMIILSIGVSPRTELAEEAGLEIGSSKG